eukprot:CAMPEP_0170496858 /NCGR_PEP_ID=MMETSP0208-20121228/22900_1 /TAXON_ID=197538 /ORGANISM="Strombidium inclinatum, Strain S3" /LENGTH=79 /DNA_ID=CAMNT_0010773497 /DNA_START=59 /DNA_END=298 /DNA_ORIENTATION=+
MEYITAKVAIIEYRSTLNERVAQEVQQLLIIIMDTSKKEFLFNWGHNRLDELSAAIQAMKLEEGTEDRLHQLEKKILNA